MSNPDNTASTRSGSTSGVASGSGTRGSAAGSEPSHPHGYPSNIKLPTFWLTRPELWFIQVESAFRNRQPSITEDIVKFDCVIAALPNDVLEKVEHVLTHNNQVGGRYAALQNALVESYGRSPAQRQAELIEITVKGTLGDLKPSDFLTKIRSLSGEEYEAVERAILLNALPAPVRTILSNSKAANNKRLALEANQVLEQHLIASAKAGAAYEVQEEPFQDVDAISGARPSQRQFHQVRQQPQQQQQPQPQQSSRRGLLCRNHFRYGIRAYNCSGGQCPMRNEPLASAPRTSGNGRAGR